METATPVTTTGRARWGAAAVATAPVVLLAAFLAHPFLARIPDAEGVADAVAAAPGRWAAVHLLTAVASGLVALAFLAIRAHLRDAGDDRSSAWGLPFVVFGSILYAFLPGVEFAPLAAVEAGADVAAVQSALQPYIVPAFALGALTFGIGILGFVRGLLTTEVLGRGGSQLVAVLLVVMALSRFVPLGVLQFHVQGLAAVAALWPLAAAMWRADRLPTTRRTPAVRGT